MRELHLFAGIGGGMLASVLLGHTVVGAVEREPHCQRVLREPDPYRLPSAVYYPSSEGLPEWPRSEAEWARAATAGGSWWSREPEVGGVVDGFPGRVEQVRALGNAQVPFCAATAFKQLMRRFV